MDLIRYITFPLRMIRNRDNWEAIRIRYQTVQNRVFGAKPNKRAFLVLGPESHGTHMITDILINAGCIGHAGNHVPWQPDNKELFRGVKKPWQFDLPTDLQPWDKVPPTVQDPIVWRRSLPHGGEWVQLGDMINALRKKRYQVEAVVVSRDPFAGAQSQLKWHHSSYLPKALKKIEKAYSHIFRHLLLADVRYLLVSYEALANYPEAQDLLIERLGLELPERRWPIYDGNVKWYDLSPEKTLSKFPEAWYPCIGEKSKSYFSRVQKGYQNIEQNKVFICGIARDVDAALPQMIARIEKLGSQFQDYRVVIYENDSEDGTYEHLRYWQKKNPKVSVLSEKKGAPKWGSSPNTSRMEAMAYYRNQYLGFVRKSDYAYDYLIMLDMDIPLGFSYDGIAHSLSYDDWDVIAANGILVPPYGDPIPNPLFFDAFAFRAKGAVKAMDMEEVNALQFQRGEDLVPVASAFGGLAIYRKEAIDSGAFYEGSDCEHVVFHQALKKAGFHRQFLNPSQIVLYTGRNDNN